MEDTTNNVPVNVEATNGPKRHSKKSGKEDKSRRKDDGKSIEQVMKSLNVMTSTEEKFAAMCKKYTEIVDENRKLQLTAKHWEKGVHSIQREKEQLQTDHSKAVLARSRLETLCRELQRQNKQIKDESLLKVREEEEKRKEVSAKFNTTLAEITTLMSSSNEKTNLLRDENVEITKKFKSICEQSSIQQQQVDKMNTQRKLESELTEARLTKQRLEFTAEKEILLKEKQQMFMDMHTLHARIKELEASEMSLKSQVTLYADRYDEFQTALTKSNEVFGGFKGEMEKMSKKITRLEKETSTWKLRWEKSHQSFLEVVAEKAKCEGELSLANRKHTQLDKLCRTLQTERVLLLAQIKGLSQSPSTNDSSIETETAHIESTLASAATIQSACTMGKEAAESLKLISDESSSEKLETGDEFQESHTNDSEVTNIAQTAFDNFANVVGMTKKNTAVSDVSIDSPALFDDGDSPSLPGHPDDVNALTIDKTPAIHANGGNARAGINVINSATENRGSKVGDAHSVHKKGAKSRNGVKDNMQSDTVRKNKSPLASDSKKVSLNNTKNESPSEKKDKKCQGEGMERKDEGSLKEKNELDLANEMQRKGNTDVNDTNKVSELIKEATTAEPLSRNQTLETDLVGSTNTTSSAKSVDADKKEHILETKLIKDSNIVEEKKDNAQVTATSVPAKKPDFEKKVKVGGATNKIAHEKKHVDRVESMGANDELDSTSLKEEKEKVDEEVCVKIPEAEKALAGNIQPVVGMKVIKGLESNTLVNLPSEVKKSACIFGVESYAKVSAKKTHVEKKIPDIESKNNVLPYPAKEVDPPIHNAQIKTPEVLNESKVLDQDPEIEKVKDARLTDKIPPPLENDMEWIKAPEKPKRSEKVRVEANKIHLPTKSAEDKNLDDIVVPEESPAVEVKVDQVESQGTSKATLEGTGTEAADTPKTGPSVVNANAQQNFGVKKEKVVAKKRKK